MLCRPALALSLACGLVSLTLEGCSPSPSITCAAEHASCSAAFAVSGEGCCTFSNGVCCSNKQTCCPEGTTCQLTGGYLTDCVSSSLALEPPVKGRSVCKPGAQRPLPPSPTKSVIVLGDSVSIGYTPTLAQVLTGVAEVQHSPYDTLDGGAEETAYGLQCLEYFVKGPDGALLEPDILLFNFGLHDGPLGNSTVPGQQGNSSVYAGELEQIVVTLQGLYAGRKTQLLFALTSPMMCDANANGNVVALNAQAAEIMQRHGVQTVDPYTPIVEEFGPIPTQSFLDTDKCFCPHCPRAGYEWLANHVLVPKLREMLDIPASNRFLIGTAMVCTLVMLLMDSAAYLVAVDIKELKYSDRDDTARPRNVSTAADAMQELPTWGETETSKSLTPRGGAAQTETAARSAGVRWRNVSVRQQEQIPLTAALLWGSVIAAGNSSALLVLLPSYVALRLLYVVSYVRAWQPMRSIAWILSQLAVLTSAVVGLLAALGT